MARPRVNSCLIVLALLGAALGGCSTRTNLSATGNSPPLYTHVYVTAQAVWFNGSASAGPDDGGWARFALSRPVTVDLVADSGGNFANLVTDLRLAPGSYSQVRFVPVDASTPLAASAQTLGARYNMEVDYVDSGGVEHQLPLELLNPDKGLGVQATLTVPIGNIGASVVGGVAGTGTAATQSPFGTTATGTTTATTTTGFSSTSSATSATTTAEFALRFDAARDITAFTYGGVNGTGGVNGALLSSHVTAADLSKSGGIQGQLTLTNLTLTSANGTPGLTVTAESLSADGSRHVVVASSPVSAGGNFTLYPLAADSSNNTSYDIVIHGAGIATIIVKDVLIPPTGRNGLTAASLTGGAGTSTTGSTVTQANPDTSAITPANLVSVGTLLPRAAGSYTANIANGSAPLPAGAEVGFYQTLPGAGEVPYLIEATPVDPFNQVLGNAQALSSGTVDSGTYVSNGGTVTLVSAAPQEAAGTYQVAASAPSYTDGSFGVMVSAPTTTGVTAAGPVTLSPLSLASGVTAASLAATIRPANPGKYDQGEIMLSANGQLVASAALDAALAAGGGTVTLSAVPGGTPGSLYYVTVRAWSSGNPTSVQTRQWYPTAVDLRSASSASVDLTVD